MLTFLDREEDDLGATDDVLERHVADTAAFGSHAAVGRVVAIVAHHEIMTGRHVIWADIVVEAMVDQIERGVGNAVRRGLAPAFPPLCARALLGLDEVLDALALDRLAIDVENAV